ncbi:13389_t:CDS:1, partial [Dentiscutata erythropus]
LKTIFPKASKREIKKYRELFSDVKNPVLIIVPNRQWINQHGQNAYNNIMNSFATVNLLPNRQRDKNSLYIFHFEDSGELFNAREAVRPQYPNVFFIQPSLQALIPSGQFEPV